MPKGLKVFFSVLIVLALVLALPVMQVLTLARLTVINPRFYARPAEALYNTAYALALDGMTRSLCCEEDVITDGAAAKLDTAIREAIPPEEVIRIMEKSLPRILSYILNGGEVPVIDYGEIVEDVREGFWDSGVFQDMLADRIRLHVELTGLTGVELGDIDVEELARTADDLLLATRFDAYYADETREQARIIVYEACLDAAVGDETDLMALPFPDAVDFMPPDEVMRALPFSAAWDRDSQEDFAMAMADVRYAIGVFRVVFWTGWAGVVVLLVLLLLIWLKKPSVFMNITGSLFIGNGATLLLFFLACRLLIIPFAVTSRWTYWDIPVRLRMTLQAIATVAIQSLDTISLAVGIMILAVGITLLVLGPIMRKKEAAKEQIAA